MQSDRVKRDTWNYEEFVPRIADLPCGHTRLAIDGVRFMINGKPTYEGCPVVEGCLFNLRAANAIFDDTLAKVTWWDDDGQYELNNHAGYGPWKPGISAAENTRRFIEFLPVLRDHGILAVNICMQGGTPVREKNLPIRPGSAGAPPNGHRNYYHNSAFRMDGSLDHDYTDRLGACIAACDRLGMVCVVQFFYFGQDAVFNHDNDICIAVDNAVDWICSLDRHNIIVEIANEVMRGHFKHAILKPDRVRSLIDRAKRRVAVNGRSDIPISTSEAGMQNLGIQWTEEEVDKVFSACDLVIIHGGDAVETGRIDDLSILARKVRMIRDRSWYKVRPVPILSNESSGEANFDVALHHGISFGLFDEIYQTVFPTRWELWDNRARWFFDRVKVLTRCNRTEKELFPP